MLAPHGPLRCAIMQNVGLGEIDRRKAASTKATRRARSPAARRDAEMPSRNSALARGLEVLVALAERGDARAGELAGTTGVPVSTAYRYLRVLREHELVVEEGGVYRCGPLFARVARPEQTYRQLVCTAGPLMQRLTALTGETVTLAVRIGVSHALCIHQTESPNADRTGFRIGQTLPLHAGAGERVLLAFAPDDVIQRVMIGELERYTANTPDRHELARKLVSTRHSWITTSRSEYVPGAIAVAVPVAADDQVICSLTVSGPSARCDAAWQARIKPVLLNAGRALEHLLRVEADQNAAISGRVPRGRLSRPYDGRA